MYDRGAGNRGVVVCGGFNQSNSVIALCEELPIDARGLPASRRWRSFASLPFTLQAGCMSQVNGKVRYYLVSFFA